MLKEAAWWWKIMSFPRYCPPTEQNPNSCECHCLELLEAALSGGRRHESSRGYSPPGRFMWSELRCTDRWLPEQPAVLGHFRGAPWECKGILQQHSPGHRRATRALQASGNVTRKEKAFIVVDKSLKKETIFWSVQVLVRALERLVCLYSVFSISKSTTTLSWSLFDHIEQPAIFFCLVSHSQGHLKKNCQQACLN